MSDYVTIKTDKGLELDAAASTGSKLTLTTMAIGDGGGDTYTPTSDQTALKGEKVRVNLNSLNQDDSDPKQWSAQGIFPADKGGFTAREAGLFTDDGTLYAVASIPPTYRPTPDEGATGSLDLSLSFAVSAASSVEVNVDPSTSLINRDQLKKTLGDYYPLTGGNLHGQMIVDSFVPQPGGEVLSQNIGAEYNNRRAYLQMGYFGSDNTIRLYLWVRDENNNYTNILMGDNKGSLKNSKNEEILSKPTADNIYLGKAGGEITGNLNVVNGLTSPTQPPLNDKSPAVVNTSWFQAALAAAPLLGKQFQAASGYITLPGGLILQWGSDSTESSWPYTKKVKYTIPFPTAALCGFAAERNTGGSWNQHAPTVYGFESISKTTATVRGLAWQNVNNVWVDNQIGFFWMVIGY